MLTGVHLWWFLISLVGIINISIWLYSARHFAQRKRHVQPQFYQWRRWVFWLSGIYVMVCAFRSFLPRIDLERICLVDTWLSNMFVGRAVTTVAEIAFIIQCAILLREAGISTRVRTATVIYRFIVPIVLVAEACSWYAIVTTNYLGSVIEESLWTLAGSLLLISFIALWPHVTRRQRYYIGAMGVYALGFVMFMVLVDVPMYWHRWQAGLAHGVTYYSFMEGIADMLKSCKVNFSMQKWHEEIPWMTLYFSVTVWVSMAFAYAPSFNSIKYPKDTQSATKPSS